MRKLSKYDKQITFEYIALVVIVALGVFTLTTGIVDNDEVALVILLLGAVFWSFVKFIMRDIRYMSYNLRG